MLMLMPLQQFCECESRIWVCRGYVSVSELCECELSATEWECECAGRFNVPSRAQHLQNVFCLRLKVCYKKYFMTCKSINKKVQLHPHALPPAPIHFPHSFVGPASFIANVGAAKLRSRFILCPARYSFRFLGYVSCFFPPSAVPPSYFVTLLAFRFVVLRKITFKYVLELTP